MFVFERLFLNISSLDHDCFVLFCFVSISMFSCLGNSVEKLGGKESKHKYEDRQRERERDREKLTDRKRKRETDGQKEKERN